MKTEDEKHIQRDKFFLFYTVVFVLGLFLIIQSVDATIITDYTDLSTNTTLHIKTDNDLSINYSVLIDNKPLEYTVFHDIIQTGLETGSTHYIIITGDNGLIQEIPITLEADEVKPFYLKYGIVGLFVISMLLIVLGYLVPMLELIAIPIELIGFIQAIKAESAFITLLFVIMFVISCLIFGKYGKNVIR